MIIKKKIGILLVVLASIIMSEPSFGARELNFPSRPIAVVVNMAPGSGTDLAFVPFKKRLGKYLGQPVVVDYKTGAAGSKGALFVAKAKPDGYTILNGNKGGLIMGPLTVKGGAGYTLDDLIPICTTGRTPTFFQVKYESPYKTLQDWIEAAKTKKMTYSTYGTLGTAHLTMEYLQKAAGFKATHVPAAGGAHEARVLAAGGHVDMAVSTLFSGMIGPGRLRPIATTFHTRMEKLPDVPSLVELGYPVFKTDWSAAAYWAWAPKGVSKEIIGKIYGAYKKVMDTNGDEIKKAYENLDIVVTFSGPEETSKAAHYEYATIKQVIDQLMENPK